MTDAELKGEWDFYSYLDITVGLSEDQDKRWSEIEDKLVLRME